MKLLRLIKFHPPIYTVRLIILVALLLSIITPFATAQQIDTLKVELDTVKVKALRLNLSSKKAPFSLSIKDRSLQERNAKLALTLDQITAELPGIWVNDRENYALGERITIRGLGWRSSFGVRGIQVVLDDIPLTVADGQSMLNTIDPSFIKKVELVRGPASSFWGNSSGGVLYLSTPTALEDTPTLKIRSSAGSYGTIKQDIQYSQSFDKHDVTAYSSYLYEGGYRDHSSAKLFRSGINGSIEIDRKTGLEYMGAFVAMPQAESPSGLTGQQVQENPRQANTGFVTNNAGKQVYQAQLGTNFYTHTPIGSVNLTGYGIYRDLTNPLPFAIINVNRWAGGLRGTLEKSFNEINVKAGFDTKLQFDDRLELDNNGGIAGAVQVNQLEKVVNQAFFITSDLRLGPINILAGLRFDWLKFSTQTNSQQASGSRTFQSLNPNVGIAYNRQYLKLYTNFSTSYESPTTTELVNSPNQQSGFNPNLKPEKTIGIESGVKGNTKNGLFTYDIAIYQLWIDDILFPFQTQNNGATFFRNEGNTIHRGIEGAFSVAFARRYSIGATYNYTDATFQKAQIQGGISLKGNSVPGIPAHRLNLSADYSSTHWQLGASYEHISSYAANNANTVFNDAYGVIHTQISYIWSFKNGHTTLQPFVNANNLLDTQYNGSVLINAFGGRYFEPAAGFNWQAGLSVNL